MTQLEGWKGLKKSGAALVAIGLVASATLLALAPVALSRRAVAASQPEAFRQDPFYETMSKACSKCHVAPRPDIIPRGFWRERIQEMAQRSLIGTGLTPGEESTLWQMDLSEFVRYLERYSQEKLPPPEPWPAIEAEPKVHFAVRSINPLDASPVPIIANVRLLDLDGDARLELIASDMGHGLVFYCRPYEANARLKIIAHVPNPCHAEMIDFDGDGVRDLLIADLGDFLPADHEKGSVVLLRQTAPGEFETQTLAARVPRAADVQAVDLDADKDLDLIVAAYGWHTVGGTFVYENETAPPGPWKLSPWTIDARPGPIHVPVADLNSDGRPDFVDLVAQQYEHVVAFINRGPGKGFRPETLYRGPYPSYGSSGIELVDLDQDGDLDVLMTNGDTLDDNTIKPYHGIQWLENRGSYPFEHHWLAPMVGVHRAEAADLDADGDLDIVACAFFADPDRTLTLTFPSLIWLEQTRPGVFKRHTLEMGTLMHPTLEIDDFDRDGDADVVVGNFTGFTFNKRETGVKTDTWVALWENLRIKK